MYEYGTLFWTEVKYIATSSLHDERLQDVAVSGDAPGMLHGDAAVQICTDFTESALDGPNVVGTARGALPDGVEVGVARGVLVGWADGDDDDVCWAIGEPVLRPDSSLIPTIPRMRMITTATAAGTSHDGRSARIPAPPPPAGGRGTVGLRIGGGTVGVREGGGSVGAGGVSTAATPVPRGSAGTASPGFQAGCSTGVHVGSAGGGEAGGTGAGGVGATGATGVGGEVEKGDAGATGATGVGGEVEKGDASAAAGGGAGAGSSHVGALGGSGSAGGGVSTGAAGAALAAGASDHVGTAGIGRDGGAGGSSGSGGAGTGGRVTAGIDG